MRTWTTAIVLIAAGAMFQPTASAQSIWQKMKQAAKQAEQNAQAQSRQAHTAQQTRTTAPSASAAAAGGAASSGAAAQAPHPAVDLSSPAMKALYRKLDVGGVRLGMTPQAAQAALQSRNRALVKGEVQPFVFSDLPNTEFTSRADFNPRTQPQDESVELGLTLQPMQPEVLAILRQTKYELDHMPTGDNTIAALRAKYGPETTREDEAFKSGTNLRWLFDGEGNLVSKSRAQKFLSVCGGAFLTPGSGYISNGLRKGWDVNCAPYTFLKAEIRLEPKNLRNSRGQSLPRGLVMSMTVSVTSFPLLTKTVTATRQMVLAAKAANLQKNKKAADKNVPVL